GQAGGPRGAALRAAARPRPGGRRRHPGGDQGRTGRRPRWQNDAVSAALSVEGLVKTYPGTRKTPAVEAVRGVSFEVAPGEFFGLLGPNGAGKSTTLGCITTLVRPTAGRRAEDGIDVVRRRREAHRRSGAASR